MTLTVGSLFSGIGGFDLGLERAGMKVIWQSEIDTFASKVLKKHWPDVPNLGDITKVDWSNIERPDVICGGYPCQPFSQAGKRGGENDARHLWPAMHNAICVLRPRYALMENVRGHLSLGFGRVLGDLAEIGYDAEWQVIPAAAVGALHKRDRVFIVAYANDTGSRTPKRRIDDNGATQIKKRQIVAQSKFGRLGANVANTKSKQSNGRQPSNDNSQLRKKRLQQQIGTSNTNVADTHGKRLERQRAEQQATRVARESKEMADTNGSRGWGVGSLQHGRENVFRKSDQLRGENGFTSGSWWEIEPNVGRVANGVSDRVDRLKGLGNAIVPQVAELVGALVVEHSQN
jgi:DNA (cytosine-5)-methyltransferase 1|tara:strand:- start:38 stop:1075 length:1038 start_codon:yes stop_codon:yes gene_type:complete